jgi:hypothetical protein
LANALLAALIPSAPRAPDTKKASGELERSEETDADAEGCVDLKRLRYVKERKKIRVGSWSGARRWTRMLEVVLT